MSDAQESPELPPAPDPESPQVPEVPEAAGPVVEAAADETGWPTEDVPPAAPQHAEPPSFSAALEAVLLVADQPIAAATLAQVLERPVPEVEQALEGLAAGYVERGSGFDLRCVAGGWRYFTREDCAPFVERFILDGQQARLTQAALETLAVIAYREPVTRSRVSAVRGVNVDGVVRTLLARGLIAESGHDPSSGAVLYATTPLFLERLGLQSRDDLPSLAPLLPELAELDDDSTSS